MSNSGNAGVPAGNSGHADVDVGVPGADVDVGAPRLGAPGVPSEWHSRGYLPHRDRAGLLQAITFRLADSLPQEKLDALEEELARLPQDRRDIERRRRIEQWLDAGMGCCALAHPAVARTVQDSLRHFHGERYRLLAWCVMPNHVHVLVEPRHAVSKIVQGWKSFTARWALARNEALGLRIPYPHRLWMREYWDRYIRDDNHLHRAIEYIHENPVKAGLCQRAEEWRWSSAGTVEGPDTLMPASDLGTPTSTSAQP